MMKTHSIIGHKILSKSKAPVFQLAAEIALGHHERWDGTGYPKGLAKDAIPLAGRLMAIADVYDALISKRSYKNAWTHKDAVNEIVSKVGTQFDPLLVEAFKLEEDHFNLIAENAKD